MKKIIFLIFILIVPYLFTIPANARDREVTTVNKAEIFSEGLYFKVCNINTTKNTITLTVQAKNKSALSQAVYVELWDGTTAYQPLKPSSIGLFNPLKFNKPVTEKLIFSIPDTNKNYKLALYSRDVFKKNKKKLIKKMCLKEIKAEIENGNSRSMF